MRLLTNEKISKECKMITLFVTFSPVEEIFHEISIN